MEVWSFEELRRRWLRTLTYLSFESTDPSALDGRTAIERLAQIEAEWQRRAQLGRNDPRYFDWPSTEAPKAGGRLGPADWYDIGVLGYLNYHVGKTSSLSQR